MSNRPHILLVDDDEDMLFIMKEILEELCYKNRVDTVLDGQEALLFLRKLPPFQSAASAMLVLLDLNMPHTNGFDVLNEMQNDRELKEIPVVVFTASLREEDRTRALSSGARNFVTKPMSYQELTEALRRICCKD